MAKSCTICTHAKRAAIDLALLNGGSIRVVAATFGFDDFSSMARHSRNHLPGVLAKVALQTEAQVRAELRPDMEAVLNALWTLYQQLDVRGRQLCLATITQLENNQHGDIVGVEGSDRDKRPVRVDRPPRQAKRVKPAIRAVPTPAGDLKYMF